MVDSNCSIRLGGSSGTGATMLNDCVALSGRFRRSDCQARDKQGCRDDLGFSRGFGSQSCSSFKGIVHQPWNPHCTNAAVPFSCRSIDRIEGKIRHSGPKPALPSWHMMPVLTGSLTNPMFAKAIKQVQLESGMDQSGELSCNLIKVLKMRLWGI